MKKIMALLAMIAVVTGCGGEMWGWHQGAIPSHLVAGAKEVIPVYLDTNFTATERAGILSALKEWQHVFNGQIVFTLDEKGFKGLEEGKAKFEKTTQKNFQGWFIVRMTTESEEIKIMTALGMLPERALAFATTGGHDMVVIADRMGNRDWKTIVMHEMGHLLGVRHLNSPSLMHDYYGGGGQYDCIDKLTVSEVAAHHGLKLEELNYCVTPGFE